MHEDEEYNELDIQVPDIDVESSAAQAATMPAGPQSPTRRRAAGADLLKAHVALLEKEVIHSRETDLFRLLKYHSRTLQGWHEQHTGWHIQRGSSVIRLVRHPSSITSGYIYENWKDPRDFACLAWILWYAENRQLTGRGNDQQFLLSQLAEQIQEQSANVVGEEAKLDFRKLADRYSIRRALQYLEDLGGVQLVDGQTKEWIEQTPDSDVLYEFSDVIHALVSALDLEHVTQAAARLNDKTALLQPTLLPGAGNVDPLARAWRALLIGPALFRYDDPKAFAALKQAAGKVANELSETFGWLLDMSRDYACVVRGSGMATGPVSTLNVTGATDQAILLLCGAIRGQVESGEWSPPDEYGCLHISTEEITSLFYGIRERYGDNWGSTARDKSSPALLGEIYEKMRQIALMRGPDAAGNVLLLPTAARYAVGYGEAGQETKVVARSRSRRTTKSAAAPLPLEWSDGQN